MWNKNSFILAWFGVFLSITTPAFGDGSNMPLQPEPVHFQCGRGQIIRGNTDTYNVNSICGDDVYLYVDPSIFTTSDFPLELAVYLRDNSDVETVHLTKEINSIPADGDITSLIPTDNLAIEDGGCNNREATVYFKLTSPSNTDISFEESVKRHILCDCSAVDLKLSTSLGVGAPLPDITLHETAPTLKAAMLEQGFTFQLIADADGTIPIFEASPGATDALPPSLYLTAFVVENSHGMTLAPETCTSDYDVPEILAEDKIIAYKEFTTNADMASIGSVFDAVKNDEKLDLCGEHMLVLKLDTMNTCWNEVNKCNNYLAIRIHSSRPCDAVGPQCDLIGNGWTVGEARGIYRGMDWSTMMPHVKMIDFDGEGWIEANDTADELVMDQAYGRMMLLKHIIDDKVATGTASCSLGPNEMLDTMDDNPVDDSGDPSTVTLPSAVDDAKIKMQDLRNGGDAQTAGTIKQEMEAVLNNLETDTTGAQDFSAKLIKAIKKGAIQRVVLEADKILNGGIDGTVQNICEWLPDTLSESRWIHMANPTDVMDHVVWLAGDVAHALIEKPELACLEEMLKRFITYASDAGTTDSPNADFMFDAEDIKEKEKDLNHCGKPNKCIQKMRRVCEAEHITNVVEIQQYSNDICKLHIMKNTAENLYQLLGVDLRGQFQERDAREGRHCKRDPMKPRSGLRSLWKTTTDTESGKTYFEKGVITADKMGIALRKVAICSCQPCNTPSDTGTSTEYDGMAKKRRRRK